MLVINVFVASSSAAGLVIWISLALIVFKNDFYLFAYKRLFYNQICFFYKLDLIVKHELG